MFDERSFSTQSFSASSWLLGLVAVIERAAKSAGHVFIGAYDYFVASSTNDTTVNKHVGQ